MLDKSGAPKHRASLGGLVVVSETSARHGPGGIAASVSLFLLVATGMGLVQPVDADAQAMREVRSVPVDCRDLRDGPQQGGMQPWQAFVRMEHCDRIKRLVRLSANLPPNRRPIFFEGIVPADRLPSGFGVDMPVLRVVFPDHVFFDTGKSELRHEADPLVAIVAESLRREPPDVALFVAGHADKRGDGRYNQALSIDRANVLAEAIFEAGIAFSSIWRIGFGEDMPLDPGEDEASLDRNRRIEFLFAAKPEAIGVWMADQQLSELCQARDSLEAERCKTRLNLRRDYEAVEIVRRPAVRLDTPRPSPRSIGPDRLRHGVTPADPGRTGVRPAANGVVSVTPAASRRIRIDPVLRKATPVRVDL